MKYLIALLLLLSSAVTYGQPLRQAFDNAHSNRGGTPISGALSLDSSDCIQILRWGLNNSKGRSTATQAFDTLKHFIDSCAYLDISYEAFGGLATSFGWMGKNDLFPTYRAWLISVLYLNPSDKYFCHDFGNLFDSYTSYVGTGHGVDYNSAIAVLDYMASCGRCDTGGYWDSRVELRRRQLDYYHTVVTDTINNPLDTTLPTLRSLGIDVEQSVEERGAAHADILSLRATQSPFDRETAILFDLSEIDVAEIEVYNVLGTSVRSIPRAVYMPGEHRMALDLANEPSGTYYVHLTTAHGDTRTVKLVKR